MIGAILAAALALAPGKVPHQPASTLTSPVEEAYTNLTKNYHRLMFDQQVNLQNYEIAAQNIILAGMAHGDMSGVDEAVGATILKCRRVRDGYSSRIDQFAATLAGIEQRIEQIPGSPEYQRRKSEFHQVLDQHRRNLPQYCLVDKVKKGLELILEITTRSP